MKSEIDRSTKFAPIRLEITFETAFELSDFVQRLKHDNHLPNPSDGLIRKLEAFEYALDLADRVAPIAGNLPCPHCKERLWGWPNKPIPLHCRNRECPKFLTPAT